MLPYSLILACAGHAADKKVKIGDFRTAHRAAPLSFGRRLDRCPRHRESTGLSRGRSHIDGGGTCNTHTSHLARATPLSDSRAVLRVSNLHGRQKFIAIELAHIANYKPNGLTEERHLGILALPSGLVWQRAEASIGRGGWSVGIRKREWFGIRSDKIAHLCCT